MIGNDVFHVALEPMTQSFVEALRVSEAFPFSALPVADVRAALTNLQSGPIGKPDASINDMTFPVGPEGTIRVRIVRPKYAPEAVPVVMFFHGGCWVAGDVDTHDRLVREIAIATRAAVVFVSFRRPPEVQFPLPVEEAYAATEYVVKNANRLNLDGTRLAVVGDGTGGNIAIAVAILCKERRGPKIVLQVLFYPVTSDGSEATSCMSWCDGPWVTKHDMDRFWDAYLPDRAGRLSVAAAPLNATIDQLRGLPDALLITAEVDMLRDEGEAFARKLSEAGVRTTCTRYIGTIHDFVMLNALADTPAARGAIEQANFALRCALA